MKKIFVLLFFPLICFGQSKNNSNTHAKFPQNITPYSIIDLKNGDTLCWYWNEQEIKDWVNGQGLGTGTVTSITYSTGLSGGTITTSGTVSILSTSVNGTPIVFGSNNTVNTSGSAGGDLTGSYPNPTLKNTGTSGTYGGATAIPIITTDAQGRVTVVTTVNPTATPSGSAGGDLTGSYPNPTLATAGTSGTYGGATSIPIITTDTKGRITGITTVNPVPVNPVYTATVSLTSAMLLTINTTPIQIIAAPGAGNIIVPVSVVWDYTFVTTAYGSNLGMLLYEDINIAYGAWGNQTSGISPSLLGATSSQIRMWYPVVAANGTSNIQYFDNRPLMLTVLGANPTAGDGTAKLTVIYMIVSR